MIWMSKSCLVLEASPVLSTGKSFQMREVFGSVLLHSVDQIWFRVCSLFVHFYWQPYVTPVCLCWSVGSLELDCVVDLSGIFSLFIMKTILPLLRGPWCYTYMPTVRVLNDVGKFGRPLNSEGHQPNSLMVVVVVYTCSGTDSWRRRTSTR